MTPMKGAVCCRAYSYYELSHIDRDSRDYTGYEASLSGTLRTCRRKESAVRAPTPGRGLWCDPLIRGLNHNNRFFFGGRAGRGGEGGGGKGAHCTIFIVVVVHEP